MSRLTPLLLATFLPLSLCASPLTERRCRVFSATELEAERATSGGNFPLLAECAVALGGKAPLPLEANTTSTRDRNSFSSLQYNRRFYDRTLEKHFGSEAGARVGCKRVLAEYACVRVYPLCYPRGSGVTSLPCKASAVEAVRAGCGDEVAKDVEDDVRAFSERNTCYDIAGADGGFDFKPLPYAAFTECAAPGLISKVNEVIEADEKDNCGPVTSLYPEFKAAGCGGDTFSNACGDWTRNCRTECVDVAREPSSSPANGGNGGNSGNGTSDESDSDSNGSSVKHASIAAAFFALAAAALTM